jgi:hypothetical protein
MGKMQLKNWYQKGFDVRIRMNCHTDAEYRTAPILKQSNELVATPSMTSLLLDEYIMEPHQ